MRVHLGPVKVAEMQGWLGFSRRVMCELRTEPGDMASESTRELVADWNKLVDGWAEELRAYEPIPGESSRGLGGDFVWDGEFQPDRAEFLLHSLQKTLYSTTVQSLITAEDLANHGWITLHIMQRFVDSLAGEGQPHAQYVEQLRQSMRRFSDALELA